MGSLNMTERVFKVVLFGVTGCGKSSIINLLADEPVADVSTGVEACTKRARWYPVSLGGKRFRLWDTTGFNQAETRDMNPLSPYEQAHSLLRSVQEGVDLILLCSRKDGINASLRNLYWLLNDFFFNGRAQIALVLTHCDTPDPGWWERNQNNIVQRSAIPVDVLPHACISTVQPRSSALNDQSKQALRTLLDTHATTPVPLRLALTPQSASALVTHCQLASPDATALVDKFSTPKRPYHVIFFGEAGVGKSSVVNLLTGTKVAEVSRGIHSCTLDSRRYKIQTGVHQFVVWDTMGLNGTHLGHNVAAQALENVARLIRELHDEGGVDLLVFCKQAGRLSPTELNSYRLFQEFLCEGQVPVALVITHLESYTSMEQWWEENGDGLLKTNKMNVIGHACITSLPADEPMTQQFFGNKLLESRLSVQALLEDSVSHGSTFNKEPGVWVMSFLRKVVGMIMSGNVSKRDKITAKNLMERCELSKDQAEELIKLLYSRAP